MKRHVLNFVKRGLFAMGFGPICLGVVYLFLWKFDVVETISVGEMVLGILTVSLMAFFAGGIGVVYEIEQLPLLYAALLHSVTLYLDYVVIYLINGWLADGAVPFLIFTACFVVCFWMIWFIVYAVSKSKVEQMNREMNQKRVLDERVSFADGK